jgi:hypothetical protein
VCGRRFAYLIGLEFAQQYEYAQRKRARGSSGRDSDLWFETFSLLVGEVSAS